MKRPNIILISVIIAILIFAVPKILFMIPAPNEHKSFSDSITEENNKENISTDIEKSLNKVSQISEPIILGLKIGDPYSPQVKMVALDKLKYNKDFDSFYFNVYLDTLYAEIIGNVKFGQGVLINGDTILSGLLVRYSDGGAMPTDLFLNVPKDYTPLHERKDFKFEDYFRCTERSKNILVKLFEEKYGRCENFVSRQEFFYSKEKRKKIIEDNEQNYQWNFNNLEILLNIKSVIIFKEKGYRIDGVYRLNKSISDGIFIKSDSKLKILENI